MLSKLRLSVNDNFTHSREEYSICINFSYLAGLRSNHPGEACEHYFSAATRTAALLVAENSSAPCPFSGSYRWGQITWLTVTTSWLTNTVQHKHKLIQVIWAHVCSVTGPGPRVLPPPRGSGPRVLEAPPAQVSPGEGEDNKCQTFMQVSLHLYLFPLDMIERDHKFRLTFDREKVSI